MIRGITFAAQLTTSADFAHYINTFLAGNTGRTKGIAITHDDERIFVGSGYFVTYGRYVNITGTEEIETGLVEVGTQYNRLVFTVDLSKTNTESIFEQGYFELLTSYDGYPALTQEDLDNGGMIYQIAFAKFTKTISGISNFVEELGTINIGMVFSEMEREIAAERAEFDEMFTAYKQAFVEYFEDQKAIIEGMIQDLQDQDFVTNADHEASLEAIKSDLFDGVVYMDLADSEGNTLTSNLSEKLIATRKLQIL